MVLFASAGDVSMVKLVGCSTCNIECGTKSSSALPDILRVEAALDHYPGNMGWSMIATASSAKRRSEI